MRTKLEISKQPALWESYVQRFIINAIVSGRVTDKKPIGLFMSYGRLMELLANTCRAYNDGKFGEVVMQTGFGEVTVRAVVSMTDEDDIIIKNV